MLKSYHSEKNLITEEKGKISTLKCNYQVVLLKDLVPPGNENFYYKDTKKNGIFLPRAKELNF